jgi:pimeloyl-ACP methyl ester carboxylesterase
MQAHMRIARRALVLAVASTLLVVSGARAQIAPPRTIEELKAETQARADRGAYPLIGIKPDDARAALAEITTLDRDQWAAAWSRIAGRYAAEAAVHEAAGRAEEARKGYLMAWRLYSFARWPTPNSPGKQTAYTHALDAFAHYARLLDPAPQIVRIPFGDKEIVGWLRLPRSAGAAPLVLTISALDSRKEDNVERSDAFIRRGIATFSFDMPGTGQAPLRGDVDSDKMFSRVLDYVATRPELDARRVVVQGGSWSGYWAAKLGIVERARLAAVVVQGGPIHNYFQPEWQRKALGTREYLFDLFPARASVYGAQSLDEFLAFGPKMSLKAQGLIERPSAPMLLVNGERDTQVPIADLDLMLHSGSPKEAWVNPAGGHMGRSAEWPDGKIFAKVVAPWIARQLGLGE